MIFLSIVTSGPARQRRSQARDRQTHALWPSGKASR